MAVIVKPILRLALRVAQAVARKAASWLIALALREADVVAEAVVADLRALLSAAESRAKDLVDQAELALFERNHPA